MSKTTKKTTLSDTRPWTGDDDGLLALLTFRLTSPSLIAKVLNRSAGAVTKRKKALGIVTPARCRTCAAPLPKSNQIGRPLELCLEHRRPRNRPRPTVAQVA